MIVDEPKKAEMPKNWGLRSAGIVDVLEILNQSGFSRVIVATAIAGVEPC